jgi:hypothetical protein
MAEVTKERFAALKAAGQLVPLQVVTGSMVPLIPVGTKIVVDPLATPVRWDVVVYWDGTRLICHVLWHINRLVSANGATTNVTAPLLGHGVDLVVTAENMLGVVVGRRLTWPWRLRMLWNRRRALGAGRAL